MHQHCVPWVYSVGSNFARSDQVIRDLHHAAMMTARKGRGKGGPMIPTNCPGCTAGATSQLPWLPRASACT